jgi:2-polyprenyl-3-methyl-5-hydroxy-6-metoxy-1,4-benzoquinol methylase
MRCNLCETPVEPGQEPRWRKHGFEIFKCSSCGLLFRGRLPTAEELLAIYGRDYFLRERDGDSEGYADYLSDETEHRLTARRRVSQLDAIAQRGSLLDVGSAAGFFMDEARSAGWAVRGIDVSPDMSSWGREHLGLDIASGLFQHADYPPGSFDAVTMWDYIEHSIDPAGDFSKAAEVLRPGGVLMLSTGDAASPVARVSGRRWHLLTPRHHNFFFTVNTLRSYLEQSGFAVTRVGHPGAHYSLRYIVYKLGTMAPRSRTVHAAADRLAQRPLGERSLRFNLGDIATIHARRR